MMKRIFPAAIIFFLTMTYFPGCLEEHIHTTIFADGSSERVISLKLPSTSLPENAFPLPSNSTWSVEWKETGEKDSSSKYEYIARKSFSTPDELRREYAALTDTGIIGIAVSIERRFEWFFTYIDYRETYSYRNPFGNIPVSQYLTPEEIERFQYGKDEDSLQKKVDRWSSRDESEEFYRPLIAEARRRNDPKLPASLFIEKQEECFDRVEAIDSANKNAPDSSKISLDNARDLLKIVADVLHTDAVLSLEPTANQAWKNVEAKESKMKHPSVWTYTVQMPGIVLEANSNEVEGNSVAWEFTPDKIKVGDYTMHAASRVTNTWAFVVTGVVAILMLLIAVRASIRRKHSHVM